MMDLLSFVLENRQKGFTLIETALAMLAIGLGLLAIFGLGRLGLQTAKETEYDQRCAMMADAIFETLRDYNARFVEEARKNNVPGTWWTQWQAIMDDPPSIPFPPIAGMSASDELFLRFHKPFEPAYKPEEISLTDWNPRYLIRLSGEEYSPISSSVNTIRFELIIYPDGDTYSSEYRLFRTTLTNPGGLP